MPHQESTLTDGELKLLRLLLARATESHLFVRVVTTLATINSAPAQLHLHEVNGVPGNIASPIDIYTD